MSHENQASGSNAAPLVKHPLSAAQYSAPAMSNCAGRWDCGVTMAPSSPASMSAQEEAVGGVKYHMLSGPSWW